MSTKMNIQKQVASTSALTFCSFKAARNMFTDESVSTSAVETVLLLRNLVQDMGI